MENAVEAIKMAFAVMVFVIALSVSMISFNKAKATSDVVLYAKDETNYYDYEGATGKAAENRIVGIETIIPTLYKYYKENYTVVFRTGNYDSTTGEFSNLEYLPVYTTNSKYRSNEPQGGAYLWGQKVGENSYSTYDKLMEDKYNVGFFDDGYLATEKGTLKGNKKIFSFDLEEETLRHEPWTGSYTKARENLDCFLNGDTYKNPNNREDYIKYGQSFIKKYKNKKFVETIGEYTYNSTQTDSTEDGSSISSLVKEKKKRVIIFTLIE